jgi:hypothetical protein
MVDIGNRPAWTGASEFLSRDCRKGLKAVPVRESFEQISLDQEESNLPRITAARPMTTTQADNAGIDAVKNKPWLDQLRATS